MLKNKSVTSMLVCLVLCLPGTHAWAASWQNITEGGMDVQLYVPESAPKVAGKRALMISLHGCAQKNADLKERGNWKATADGYGMVVALPAAPSDGTGFAHNIGCWDYYEKSDLVCAPITPPHTRDNRDNENLFDLVEALLADASLNIDPNQVYVTGLSSGGGETMVMGCLAPDMFAGIGINAGPTLGTACTEIKAVSTNLQEAVGACERLAGEHQSEFAGQLTSVIYGSADALVGQSYNTLNANVMAALYDVSDKSGFSVDQLVGHDPRGTGTLWSDDAGPRVSLIESDGMGHAWPAGSGSGGEISYVAQTGVNYPAYVTKFFFENNRRAQANKHPAVSADARVSGLAATISGVASDEDGSVADLTITVTGVTDEFSEGPTDVSLSDGGRFTMTSGSLRDDNAYRAVVAAIDDKGASSQAELLFDVGHPPHPPVVGSTSVSVEGDCVNIRGTATDVDGDLARVAVSIDSDTPPREATIEENAWALADVCGLKVGAHTLLVNAFDASEHASEPSEERFDISPPYEEIADSLSGHVSDQRVRFYAGSGFGAVDASYIDLLEQHGVSESFPLHGYQDQWYADPNNLLTATFDEVRIRSMLMGEVKQAVQRGSFASMEAATPREFVQTRRSDLAHMERLTTEQLIERLFRAGVTVSVKPTPADLP